MLQLLQMVCLTNTLLTLPTLQHYPHSITLQHNQVRRLKMMLLFMFLLFTSAVTSKSEANDVEARMIEKKSVQLSWYQADRAEECRTQSGVELVRWSGIMLWCEVL